MGSPIRNDMEFIFEDPEQPQMMQNTPAFQPNVGQINPVKQPSIQEDFIFEDPEQPYFNPEMPKEESWGQYLTRLPIGVASTAAKSLGKTADFFENIQKSLTGFGLPEEQAQAMQEKYKRSPVSEFISEANIERGLNKLFPKKYRDPKNTFFEKTIHRVADDLPWVGAALASGGLSALPMSAARSTGAALGSQSAESAGLGEFAQAVGGLAGSLGAGYTKNLFKSLFSEKTESGIQKLGESIRKEMYSKSEPLSKTITRDATGLEKKLEELMGKATGTASGIEGNTVRKTVFKELENADRIISQGKVNLYDLVEQKKHLNKIIRDLPVNENTKKAYYEQALGAILDVIGEAEREIPEFGKPFRVAEDLTKTISIAKKAANTSKEAMSNSFLKKIPILNYFDKPLWALSNSIPPEFMPYIKTNPKTFMKYMGDVVQSSMAGDVATTKRNLMNMGKIINHTDKKKKKR